MSSLYSFVSILQSLSGEVFGTFEPEMQECTIKIGFIKPELVY